MPFIQYIEKRFNRLSEIVIEQANEIINEYISQGYDLTLRQLYYQFVARDMIPNTDKSYKRIGSIVNDGRLAGLIDWNAIEDRTRNLQSLASWETPQSIVESCAKQFRFDRWETQDRRVEVWIEKEALAGVFARTCNSLRVPYFSCRGYVSQSEMWNAAQRLISYEDDGNETTIFHFGDHDPSGIDMTRDIQDRLSLFGSNVGVQRVALNMDQIDQYNPPPNPAKLSDARAEKYVAQYGYNSWELDALEPKVLTELVRNHVEDVIDDEQWQAAIELENEARENLTNVADQWEEIVGTFG